MQARPASGLSPRTRGTLRAACPSRRQRRFIPAFAGNTSPARATTASISVHPRVRGEHLLRPVRCRAPPGSSPRTRGTRSPVFRSGRGRSVHPRVRGEHVNSRVASTSASGSSPRTRGTPEPVQQHSMLVRFIPAYAGNTHGPYPNRESEPVHPRVRGEHGSGWSEIDQNRGSSPRTRGTRCRRGLDRRGDRFIPAYAGNTKRKNASVQRMKRFIPAYAGNTPAVCAVRAADPVHPRVRGEHH